MGIIIKKDPNTMTTYTYPGARALIALHDQHMHSFLEAWRRAKKAGIVLPQTTDPSYKSMETLLFHSLRASRNYIVWICQKLELPDPGIDPVPDLKHIEQSADAYLEHLLQRWQSPLRDVPEERFFDRTYLSRWDVEYCIESMLEHAVMHPIRHEFQLINLMRQP
jgi:uncharacterized damage-inducible protein DinB